MCKEDCARRIAQGGLCKEDGIRSMCKEDCARRIVQGGWDKEYV